jgi:hypothetical protein
VRRAIVWAASVAVAGATQVLCARFLAGRDIVAALLGGDLAQVGLAVAALLAARLFLFLLAPGWALYVLATIAVEGYVRRRAAPRTGDGAIDS